MSEMLHHNMKQGFPKHFHGKFMKKAAQNSMAQQIQKICRWKIQQLHPEWPKQVISSLIAATVFHSADHYYIDKYLSFASKSKYLKMDFAFHRASLISPNKYYTRKLKCVWMIQFVTLFTKPHLCMTLNLLMKLLSHVLIKIS